MARLELHNGARARALSGSNRSRTSRAANAEMATLLYHVYGAPMSAAFTCSPVSHASRAQGCATSRGLTGAIGFGAMSRWHEN